MTKENAARCRCRTLSLLCQIHDNGVIRQVWEILNHAYSTQKQAEESSGAAESRERIALIGDISGRRMDMSTEQLRRVDWYMDRITRTQ